jgi:SAM-dependent methyltransferase
MPMNMNKKQEEAFHRLRSLWLEEMLPFKKYTPTDLIQPLPMPKQELFDNCKVLVDRKIIIERMQKNAIVAEIGTQEGIFAEFILQVSKPKELHLFDIDFDPLHGRDSEELKQFAEMHEGDSSTSLSGFEDNYFDWIYVDGAHDYHGVKKDAEVAVRKVKPGGYLVFNDFTIWSPVEMIDYGVPYAVCETLNHLGWTVDYLALHPLGYHDIAIRKPIERNE